MGWLVKFHGMSTLGLSYAEVLFYPFLVMYRYYFCSWRIHIVIPILFGDINNLYTRIFSPAVSSPTLIEKSKILLIWMLFFISLNWTWYRRRDTRRYYILLFLSAHSKISSTCRPPAITTTFKHVQRQQPFHSKTYLYLFKKSGTKFPADWRNKFFIKPWI